MGERVPGPHVVTEPLYILGASVRAAAMSARRAGQVPVALDCFADYDLATCCPAHHVESYPDAFVPLLNSQPPGRWLYTGGLENHPHLVAELARHMPLYGNGAEVLQRVRDPWHVARVLAEAGCVTPALAPADAPVAPGRWLLKRRDSSAGLHVQWDGPLEDALQSPHCYYRQQFIAGRDYSAVMLAAPGSTQLVGITRQWIGEPRLGSSAFRYAGSLGPVRVPRAAAVLRRMGEAITSNCGLRGLFGIDFVWDGRTVWPVEINPRYTASCELLERATGRHLIAEHIAACGGSSRHAAASRLSCRRFGKAVLYARQSLRFSATSLDDCLRLNRGRTWPLVADLPHADQAIAAGHPILTLYAGGRTIGQVRQRLLWQARRWQQRLGDTLPRS